MRASCVPIDSGCPPNTTATRSWARVRRKRTTAKKQVGGQEIGEPHHGQGQPQADTVDLAPGALGEQRTDIEIEDEPGEVGKFPFSPFTPNTTTAAAKPEPHHLIAQKRLLFHLIADDRERKARQGKGQPLLVHPAAAQQGSQRCEHDDNAADQREPPQQRPPPRPSRESSRRALAPHDNA